MKIVCISDTHAKWKNLVIPPCDILISAGDYSFRGEKHLIQGFHEWLNEQDAGHIISVQGNHEKYCEANFQKAKEIAIKACPAVYFVDEGAIDIEGIKIYGSAITPWFHNWAWNRYRGADIKRHWDIIPDDTQILITHGPPAGILDIVYGADGVTIRDQVGCQDLTNRIKQLSQLKLHVFGHIHGSSGEITLNNVKYINASICDEMYEPVNPVREFIF